ncbi:MAG: efflux RND transporter periplasmic adaptor subunit, partial [Lentisphaeraceae bacterium]|nr:efflux RND transporter periplasmic adaptor subunit [Lentisphaeraceae bacterium]
LKWTVIRAPFDGRTGVTSISVGNMVGPGSDTLMTIIKDDQMKVEFSIGEKELVTAMQQKSPDQKEGEGLKGIVPELTLANNALYPHKGEVVFWDNRINPATGTLKLRAVFPNPKNLLSDGMYVRIKLTIDDAKATLLVPQSAIQKDQAGAYVLTYDKAAGTANIRRIETAGTHGVWSIVTKGLKKGEQIVVQGLQKVTPGKKIKIDPANGDK